MSDMSKRLRDGWEPGYAPVGLMNEAADHIERLEDALRAVNRWNDSPARFSRDLQEILDAVINTADQK